MVKCISKYIFKKNKKQKRKKKTKKANNTEEEKRIYVEYVTRYDDFLEDYNESKVLVCFALSQPHSCYYQLFVIYIFVYIDNNCKLM